MRKLLRMKVLFITNRCPLYRLPVFEALSKRYHTFFIFTEKPFQGADSYGNLCYRTCTNRLTFVRTILQADCDILISPFPIWDSLPTFLIMKLRRKRVVFWVEEWCEPLKIIRKLSRTFLQYLSRHCNATVVSGTAAKNHMINYGASPQKIFLSPNSSHIESPSSVKPSMQTGKFIILYLGRLVKYKGADYLIRAFSMLEKTQKNVKLIVAGRGDFKEYLESLTKELEVKNIEFVEVGSDIEKSYYFNLCNLFVLPSIWQPDLCEAWGMVLNEAMQFGKAVITTDAVGAAPDLVKNGVNGFIVKNSDSDSLYHAMKRLIENPELAKRMGEKSKELVNKQYTYENMVQGFVNAISSTYKKI